MLSHRPRHPRHDVVDIGSAGSSSVELDRVASATATYAGVYQSSNTRSGDRLRSVAERAQLSLVSLPIPLSRLNSNKNMRPMSAGKRSFGFEGDNSSTSSVVGVDATTVSLGLGSPASGAASRKPNRLFAALRRSNSFSHKRPGKNSSGRGMFSTPEERSASVSPAGSRTVSPARTTQPPSIAQIAMGLHTSRTPHLGPSHGFVLTSEPSPGAQRTGSPIRLQSHSHSHYGYNTPHIRGRPSTSPPPSRPQTASSSTRVAIPLRPSLKKGIQKSIGGGGKDANAKLTAPLAGAGVDASRSTSPSASASSMPSTPRSALSRLSLAITKGTGGGRSRLDKFLGRGLALGRGIKSPVSSSVASLNSNSSDGELAAPRKAVRFVATVENPDTPKTTATTMATVTKGGDNRLHPPRA